MNNLNLAAMALWAGLSMSCSPKTSTVKGVICDATMNTLTIVTEANDTLSFGTANAEEWTFALGQKLFRHSSKTFSTKGKKLKCGSNRCK
ncbi:hypothetical protein [Parabacteroides johnsonii]|jgi:hypothetical protein|uniref:hypothetical protein n=1 Tax=Parabacteroides johnsonii TaxID=387661 RepID=UPI00266CCEAC|nr:hypothetical protein [Parabacteroides johnsonii]